LYLNFHVFRKLAGKVIYITGASRGIGLSMALKAARDGAKIVIAAKTADPHPKVNERLCLSRR
jgi:NAD(P)-dependent dehydrogenase (short-subunit alcohol dehydrogenase family)